MTSVHTEHLSQTLTRADRKIELDGAVVGNRTRDLSLAKNRTVSKLKQSKSVVGTESSPFLTSVRAAALTFLHALS